jgi:hypothetical protein
MTLSPKYLTFIFRHGHGELTWINGRSYAGGMVMGKMQGKGMETEFLILLA